MRNSFTTLCKASLFFVLLTSLNIVIAGDSDNFCFDADHTNEAFGYSSSLDCNTAPLMVCASTYFGCPNDSIDPSNTGMTTTAPGESGCPNPTLSYEDIVMNDEACQKTIKRIWTAIYPDNSSPWLFSTCTQMMFLEDTAGPVFSNVPANISIEVSGANCSTPITWTPPVATDDCGPVTLTSSHASGDVFSEGTTTVTYTATDLCNHTTEVSFTVTVTCTCGTAPVINCPDNYFGCPGSSTDPSNTGTATAIPSNGCSNPIVTFNDQVTTAENACGELVIIRTWIATDPNDSSLTNSCTQTIDLSDNSNPFFYDTIDDITVNGTGQNCTAAVNWVVPSYDDNCGISVISNSHSNGSDFPEGNTVVTLSLEDDCGNTASTSFTITVNCVCNTPPTILCPADYSGCPGSIAPSTTGSATASSNSGCGVPVVTYIDNIITPANSCGEIDIERVWTATDPDNTALTVSCTQSITLVDNVTPTFSNVPNSINLTGNGVGCSAIATWTAPIASDNCGTTTVTSSHASGSSFTEGSTTVTYTAIDACGLSTSVSFTVNVSCACDTPPTILCPTNYFGCPGSIDPSVTGSASATGVAGCGAPVVTYVDNIITPANSCGAIEINRVWTATDSNDPTLLTSCTQVIQLTDNSAPSITNVPTNISVSGTGTGCSAIANWTEPTVNDNCGPVTLTSSHTSGTSFPEGVTTVTYTAVDACGNAATPVSFTVTVSCVCNTPPTIFCPADFTGCPGSPADGSGKSPEPTHPSNTGGSATATSSPGCGEPLITYTDQVISQNDCGETTINRIWTATDANNSNLSSSCTQVIVLVDNTNPTLIGMPSNIILSGSGASCNAIGTWTPPTSTDNCSAVSLSSTHSSGSSFAEGVTTVTYTATDNCGNSVSASFTVTVECSCSTPPVVQCNGNYFGCVGANIDPSNTGTPSVTNNDPLCTGAVSLTYTDTYIQQTSCVVEIIRAWTAIDESTGLSTSCTQFIGLYDSQTPTITNVPVNLTGEGIGKGCSAPITWTEPTVTDDCGIASFTSTHSSGDVFPEGTTIVVYTAVDNCGKTTSVSFIVTVECTCTASPIIQCPSNYFGCPTADLSPDVSGTATATVQEGCGPVTITYTDNVINNPSCKVLEVVRIWTATDQTSGLSTSCGQFIGLYDTQTPTLIGMPSDISIQASAGNCDQVVTWTPPTASDNCGATLTSNYNSGDTFSEGTTTVTYTATDGCGASISNSFTVTIECACSIAPVVTCPTDFYACVGGSTDPSATGYASVETGSGCNAAVLTYFDTTTTGDCPGSVDIIRTWQAADPDNASLNASCTQIISLSDTEAPVFANCPHDVTMSTGQVCDKPFLWFEPTATDNCSTPNTTVNITPGSTFSSGTTEVIYTATDDCGNVATCSFTVTIDCDNCVTPPVLNCPANVDLCPGSDTAPANTGTATASAGSTDCDAPTVTYEDFIVSAGPCAGALVIDRTWTATDPNNSSLTTSCVQTITLGDDTPPVITNTPHDITIDGGSGSGCTTAFPWIEPTATDNCSAVQLTSNVANGATFNEGTNTVTYTAVDDCGNTSSSSFTVTVLCTVSNQCVTIPAITCPADFASCIVSDYSPSVTGVAVGQPGAAGCQDPIVTYNDAVITTGPCLGATVIERTWTATDPTDASLAASCVQTISLSDTQVPTLVNECPDDISIIGDANCTAAVTWSIPSATDNCGSVTTTSTHNSGDTFGQGITTVTYTFTDACGNVATCSFDVAVTCAPPVCTTPPVITCPADFSSCVSNDYSPATTGYATGVAGSPICGAPAITFSDVIVDTGSCTGSKIVERTWVATDSNNAALTSSCIQTISLLDSQGPTITNCPANISVTGDANCSATVTWTAPIANDNCSSASLSANYNSGSTFNEGTTTVTYTATDDCGNTSTCTFTVTVTCIVPTCDTPPTLSCPGDATVCLTSSLSPSLLGSPIVTAGNNCPSPTVGFNDVITSTGPCAGEKVIVRTWTASYPGYTMSANCTQTITVTDDIAPVILNCPANITVADSSTPATWLVPTATDDCGVQNLTGSHTPGTLFPVGVTNCSYTAVDYCGNSSICTFTVTVPQPQNPAITCPDDIVVSCGTGGGAHVSFDAPDYSSTCSPCTGQTIAGFIYMGTYNGHQYYCSTSPNTWEAAQSVCASNGGYLAVINDAAENAYLASLLTIQSAYIGLSDHVTEGNFQWVNGESVGYTNWYPGQPNDYNYDQDYVEMLNNGEWNDQYSYSALEYIMEIPCTTVVQTAGPTSGSYLSTGDYVVTYTVNDGCNNGATCSFNIRVEESITMNCPEDVTLSCPNNSMIVNWQTPTATTCCSNCSAGGQIPGFIYMGSYNGHFYYCSSSPASWPNAQTTCESLGGYLAVVNDAGENAYLSNLLTIQSAYIGLSDDVLEGSFQWVNGDPITYSNWYAGQPNNYNNEQDYVEMLNDGTWNDQYNYAALEYIMEIPGCLNVTQTAGPSSGSIFVAGTTTTVEYTATDQCGNVEVCAFDITVVSSECNSGGSESNTAFIDGVGFANVTNQSGNDGGYIDYSSSVECIEVTQGATYQIKLSPGFSALQQPVYWSVWVDWNMDGDFNDASEYIAYGAGTNDLSGMITTPSALWNGTTTMRVVMKLNGYPTSPCESFEQGETEDYCVVITGSEFNPGDDEVENREANSDATLLVSNVDNSSLNVYPNPVSSVVSIDIESEGNILEANIQDINGRIITQLPATGNTITHDVSSYIEGIYIVNVLLDNGQVLNEKLSIKR